jgi:hypothetical protein
MIELFAKVHSVLTVTLDNGGEFADHVRVAKKTGADIYFAKPYASWQRGTNENFNGRIRRFWPKKFDLATLQESLQNTLPLVLSTFSGSDAFVEGGVVTIAPVSLNKEPSLSWYASSAVTSFISIPIACLK